MGCKDDAETWPNRGMIETASNYGNDVLEARIDQVTHDPANKLVTAPANM
jgi:enhancing lycopene biosynthesis protein 2